MEQKMAQAETETRNTAETIRRGRKHLRDGRRQVERGWIEIISAYRTLNCPVD